ncbi:MAG TPA: hypothetical protein VFT01_06485 [Homoserinimonas sp.]|nr:hypothetical protein [Homoserinimonas sp.]
MSPESHAIRQGWLEVLDGLESDLAVDRALIERAIVPTQPTAWEPPQHLGPIPIDLRGRASRILAELGESSRRLTELRITTGQQLAAVRSIPSPRAEKSVDLDVTG